MTSEFWMNLAASTYDPQLGWYCATLSQPGASVAEFRMSGRTLPLEQIFADKTHIRIVSVQDNPINDAAVKIKLERRFLNLDPIVWAAIIAAIASITGVVLNKKTGYPG